MVTQTAVTLPNNVHEQWPRAVILVHGFNVSDGGRNSTDKFAPFFQSFDYQVEAMKYFWTGLIGVRACNKKLASAIVTASRLCDRPLVGVGHSNGCAILRKASLLGARFEQLIFINPALDSNIDVGPDVKWIHVWYSKSDRAVAIAALLFHHPWGNMGAEGYTGDDPRFLNYDKSDKKMWSTISTSHSDVFKREKFKYFGPRIVYAMEYTRKTGKQWLPNTPTPP